MIKIIEGNLFDTKANIIVHQVNCLGIMGAGVAVQVAKKYPHVEKEYRRYIHYCKKKSIEPLGTVQYVPIDAWAVIMADTIRNNNIIEYDKNYQYIANLFGQASVGSGLQTNLSAMRKAFEDIYNKAKVINATVAMPYKIGSCRGGAKWEDVYNIIQDVFGNSDINVEIWRYDIG